MRKIGFIAAIAATGALLLAGCSATPSATTLSPALSGSITVLAASSLTETFDQMGKDFEAAHPGTTVTFSYGGSGALATQILDGAPADVFAAASDATMKTVTDGGGAAGTPTRFATNILTIVVPPGNPGGVTALADLAKANLKVVQCDVSVPCGAASQKLLTQDGITTHPVSLEQDVKAVLTKVSTGEADAGLVYVTDAASAGTTVQQIAIPDASTVVNNYPIAVTKNSSNAALAQAFVDYVLSAAGQATLKQAGFGAP